MLAISRKRPNHLTGNSVNIVFTVEPSRENELNVREIIHLHLIPKLLICWLTSRHFDYHLDRLSHSISEFC